jgi:UrcA family protein
MLKSAIASAIALSAIFASVPAAAEPFAFRYKPQELTASGGLELVLARLDQQATRYCQIDDSRGIHTVRAAKACKTEVLSEVSAKIQNVEFFATEK